MRRRPVAICSWSAPGNWSIWSGIGGRWPDDRSHALRGHAARDAPRPFRAERGASVEAFPRRAWERSGQWLARAAAPSGDLQLVGTGELEHMVGHWRPVA
ncbi:hypothetical protein FQ192_23580 [Pseudomonas sp. ANT_J12]|nr:hypothetical protein FQ192_23580 [Pseudomonas sp. ANT_J12]